MFLISQNHLRKQKKKLELEPIQTFARGIIFCGVSPKSVTAAVSKPTHLNSVIQQLNSWIKKVTFQPLSLGVVYFRSTRSNEAKKIVKQMNHMKIPGTISAFSPKLVKTTTGSPLLDVTFFFNAPDFCRAPRTLRESSTRLQRASPGSQDKRAWRRPLGMAFWRNQRWHDWIPKIFFHWKHLCHDYPWLCHDYPWFNFQILAWIFRFQAQ